MSFQDAVRTCLQLKYADFNGRARRSEYWFFALFYGVVVVAGEILLVILNQISSILGTLGVILFLVLMLGMIVPSIAAGVRRLHDTGKPGLWLLISFIPFGGFVLLYFMVQDSQPQANLYGPSPKAVPGYGQPPTGYGQPPTFGQPPAY